MPDDMETNGGEVSDTMSDNDLEYDDSEAPLKYEDDKMTEDNFKSEIGTDGGEVKKKYDPKDPLRPRRKKARRACYACQRAHLTCGMPQLLDLIHPEVCAKGMFPLPSFSRG